MLKKTFTLADVSNFMSGQGTSLILIAAIVLGTCIGLSLPEVASHVSGQVDPTIIVLVSLILFDVRIQDVLTSLNRLSFIAAALIANFIIVPVVGFAIASVFLGAHPLFFIGLLIYFMAPCTDWFLGFTRLAKGNTALGAALLPINMIIQLLLYPVYLNIFGVEAIGANTASIFETLWQWFLIPLLLAFATRLLLERMVSKSVFDNINAIISIIVPMLLALLVGQISAANIATLVDNLNVVPLILGAIFVFFFLIFFVSETISKFMKLSYEDRVLMKITMAARNAPLMLAVAMAVIPDQPIIYAAIIIGMLIELPHLIGLKTILLRGK